MIIAGREATLNAALYLSPGGTTTVRSHPRLESVVVRTIAVGIGPVDDNARRHGVDRHARQDEGIRLQSVWRETFRLPRSEARKRENTSAYMTSIESCLEFSGGRILGMTMTRLKDPINETVVGVPRCISKCALPKFQTTFTRSDGFARLRASERGSRNVSRQTL